MEEKVLIDQSPSQFTDVFLWALCSALESLAANDTAAAKARLADGINFIYRRHMPEGFTTEALAQMVARLPER